MRKTLTVLTVTGLLGFGLIVTTLAWMGTIPGVHAVNLMDPFGRMHDDGHGHMHGGGQHEPVHAGCDGQKSTTGHHEMMGDCSDCPHGNGAGESMMHGAHGHSGQHHGHHADCPMAGYED